MNKDWKCVYADQPRAVYRNDEGLPLGSLWFLNLTVIHTPTNCDREGEGKRVGGEVSKTCIRPFNEPVNVAP